MSLPADPADTTPNFQDPQRTSFRNDQQGLSRNPRWISAMSDAVHRKAEERPHTGCIRVLRQRSEEWGSPLFERSRELEEVAVVVRPPGITGNSLPVAVRAAAVGRTRRRSGRPFRNRSVAVPP